MKKIFVVLLALTMTALFTTPVLAESRADFLQGEASELANRFRQMGFSEDSGAIRLCQLINLQAQGKVTDGSYLYDSTTGKKYYLGQPNNNIYGSVYSTNNGDGTYWFDNHEWYYNGTRGKYYRYDENGNLKWLEEERRATGTTTYKPATDGHGRYSNTGSNTTLANRHAGSAYTLSSNISGYNYYAGNVALYGGRIYGLNGFDESEVKMLAKLTNSYANGQDVLRKASFIWSVLDVKGNNTLSSILWSYYPGYNENAWVDWDMEELVREVLFRKYLEDSGQTYVGRTLPKGYGYITCTTYGNGYQEIAFSKEQNGSAYTFPDAWSSRTSSLHSPY